MKEILFFMLLVTASATLGPLEGQRRSGSLIQFETANHDPSILQLIDDSLLQYNRNIELKLEDVQKICQQRTEVTLSTDEEAKLEKKMAEFEDKMLRFSNATAKKIQTEISEALENALEKIDQKLQPIKSEIDNLKNLMSTVAKKEDLYTVKDELVNFSANVTVGLKAEMSRLLTIEDVEEHHNQILSKIEEVFTSDNKSKCEDSSKLEEILVKLSKSDRDLEQVLEHLMKDNVTSMCSSKLDEMTDMVGKLEQNSHLVTSLDTLVQSMQKKFLDKLQQLHDLTEEHQESNAIVQETSNGVPTSRAIDPTECKDSNFVGTGRSLNVCQAAVRFQKCYLEFVAFHCCRSCQDAGLLTSLPHYNGPRTVPVLQALRSLRPFS